MHLIERIFCLYDFRLVLRLWLDLSLSQGTGKAAQQCIMGETGYRTYVCVSACVRETKTPLVMPIYLLPKQKQRTCHVHLLSPSLYCEKETAATHTTQRLPHLK